jgi:transcriptional regulator with XRE-family HTH domain
MTPAAFKAWRKRLGLSQRGAGDALGLSLRAVQNYESGERRVTKTLALACAAVAFGLPPIPGVTPTASTHRNEKGASE